MAILSLCLHLIPPLTVSVSKFSLRKKKHWSYCIRAHPNNLIELLLYRTYLQICCILQY